MLFAYTYVPHAMEQMQGFVDFIFFQVWCRANTEEYGIHLFEPCDPLCEIMEELNRLDLSSTLKDGSGKWFYESVNEIFNEFKGLSSDEINEYAQCYRTNNLIEEICANEHITPPALYSDLNPSKARLNAKLSDFFKNLYSSGFLGLAFVKAAIGADLSVCYTDFVRVNRIGCCPFCGLLPVDNEFDPTREAFDHYLPKSKYPFNSVNPKNLAPSCHKCNSGNKRDKDPLHKNGRRRKAFYPFSMSQADLDFVVDLSSKDWVSPTPDDLAISISSNSHPEEIETWDDLFRINLRYRAKCCDAGGGLYWRKRIIEESENYGLSVQAMLAAEIKAAENNPWAESNFLKKAFLSGCQRAGLFDDIAGGGAAS